MLILLVALTAMCAYLYWGKNKKPDPVKPQPTPEKAFEEFRKLVGDNDPESARRLEQIQKCIYYSPELEEGRPYGNFISCYADLISCFNRYVCLSVLGQE